MGYNVFAVTPAMNSDNRNDATGAFIPGAQRIAKAYGGSFKSFNNVGSNTRKNFLKTIEDGPGGLDLFAYFGHGWKNQLGSAEIFTDVHMDALAAVLRDKLTPGGVVMLYACWAGIAGGFSTKLQQKIGQGVWVYGHTTLGHSFANPDVSEVVDGSWRQLFTGELRAAWSESLHYSDMWLRFPFMNDEYIETELNAIRLLGSWKVPGNQTYVFTWDKKNGTYANGDELCAYPEGTVSDQAGKRKGTWSMEDQALEISWDDGASESWVRPIKPSAQAIQGTMGFATRMKHTLAGKGQT